jgi:hypothetical protein
MDMSTSPGSSGNEDLNAKDKDGRTALFDAATTGNTDRVKALIAAGADVNAQHDNGQTALMDAALRGNPDCVKVLIAAGADVNAKTQGEYTALVAACLTCYLPDAGAIHRYEETIEALIAAGADVNAKATDGQTALMHVDRGSVAAVKALIAAGADVNAKDNSGCTVLMRMRARPDISAILRDAGATEPPEPLVSAPIPDSDTRVFRTSDGRLHGGRIAGLIYGFSVVLGCREFHGVEPYCLAQIMFVTGWWLSFCGKGSPALSGSVLRTYPLSTPIGITIIGTILIVLGIAGQFYFVGGH